MTGYDLTMREGVEKNWTKYRAPRSTGQEGRRIGKIESPSMILGRKVLPASRPSIAMMNQLLQDSFVIHSVKIITMNYFCVHNNIHSEAFLAVYI